MVVTVFDFMHVFTSSARLSRIVKRLVGKAVKKTNMSVKQEKEIQKAIETGQVDRIVKDWHNLMRTHEVEEGYFDTIIKDELILQREEEKELVQVERWLEEIQDPKLKAAIGQLKGRLEKVAQDVRSAVYKERVEARDAFMDRNRWYEYIQKYPKLFILIQMRMFANKERKMIIRDKREEIALNHLVSKLKDVGKGKRLPPKEEEKLTQSIKTLVDVLTRNFEEELKDIYNIIHYINIFHMHMLNDVFGHDQKTMAKLAQEHFPQTNQMDMAEEMHHLVKVMKDNLRKVYQMTSYQKREVGWV